MYRAPRSLSRLSAVHQDQKFPIDSGQQPHRSVPFQYFVLAMALGFLLTTILGVVMAFKFTREHWIVWLCLVTGLIRPVLLLYIGGGIR